MSKEQEISVRLDAYGAIDTAYYIDQAKQQRGEVFAAAMSKVAKAVKKMLSLSRSNRQSAPAYSC